MNKDLYQEIEQCIIQWNCNNKKTAGKLTRKIIKIINKNELIKINNKELEDETNIVVKLNHDYTHQKKYIISYNINNIYLL